MDQIAPRTRTMSNGECSSDASDFSDSYPSTTTISTVAVQAGSARIVLAVLRCGNWIRVRIQRMEPDLYDIGNNADEARALLEVHEHLCEKLAAKQDQISQLLSRADDLVTQQTSEGQSQVYAAMAESLNRAWRDLLGVLQQRGALLELSVECFTAAEDVINLAKQAEQSCNKAGWGHDIDSVRLLIEDHENLRRTCLLEPTHRMLTAVNSLLELLGRLSNDAGPSASYSTTGSASLEARERVAALTAKGGVARRQAEVIWNKRDRLLQLRLAVVSMESELDRIIDWFVKVGEPRLNEAQIGSSLSECQAQLDSIMALGDEAREMQNLHIRLMRHLQQATSSEHQFESSSRTVFESLGADQQELEKQLQRDYGHCGAIGFDNGLDDMQATSEESWRETHGAYTQLTERMRTTQAYIWEFLDRLENKRRHLHIGIIYYSECNVLLTQIFTLEADMNKKYDQPVSGLEDSFFERLNQLELRVPGLRQTLHDLRATSDDAFVRSSLQTQLGFPMPVSAEIALSSVSINVATNKLKEVDDGIARCRSLFGTYQERSMKSQKRQEVHSRMEMLIEWLHHRVERALLEHASTGTTVEQVADYEDFHRRLASELSSREPELNDVRIGVSRMTPSTEKVALELRLNDLSTRWNRHEQTIRSRLTLADKFLILLRRLREDEHQHRIVLERMHQLDGLESSLTGADITPHLLTGTVGLEGPDRLRSEVTLIINRLESQQTMLRDYIDQVTQRADHDFNTTEAVRFCQLQIQLNNRRLEQLRDSWVGCERFWEQWKMAREYWISFNDGACQLDDMIGSSLTRMSQSPLPSKPIDCDRVMRDHQHERDTVDQLSSLVRSRSQQVGELIGARPDDRYEDGRSWRLVDIPVSPGSGLPSSDLGRRVRTELSMQLAGLETRWSAWDRAWTTRRLQLERRGAQVGRLSTIEEVEGEIASAENNLQSISKTVRLTAPLEQVEQAERNLNQLEADIPVLRERVRSTAPNMRMQLLRGEPDELGVSELPLEVTDRYNQLDGRFTRLTDATNHCRVEINLTLRLLRALNVAEGALSQLTFNLKRTQPMLDSVPKEDVLQLQQVRSTLEEQLIRGQALADTHIPTLEQLASQHPNAPEARQRIKPTVTGFQTTLVALQRLTDEVRVRSEQSIYLSRPVGEPIMPEMITSQMISPAFRPGPPVIIRPLRNAFTDEGLPVVLATEFESGLPPTSDPYDRSQLNSVWFKNGQQVITPDYEVQLTPNRAELKIGETLTEDTAHYTCRISTPFGQAETSCDLVVNETQIPVALKPVAEESAIQPSRRQRAQQPPSATPLERPKFIRNLSPRTIRELEDVVLECQAIGLPVPTLKWYKNEQPIDNNADYQITEVVGSGTLRLREPKMILHEGDYTCRARNPVGEASTTGRLTIQPGSPPLIVRPLRNTLLTIGEPCNLAVQYKFLLIQGILDGISVLKYVDVKGSGHFSDAATFFTRLHNLNFIRE